MTLDSLPEAVEQAVRRLASGDREAQGASYEVLIAATTDKVSWADAGWRELMPLLRHKDNRVRSIAGQVLCNLARSASTSLVDHDLVALVSVTRDERFVTARHVLLGLWKLGLEDIDLRRELIDRLCERFRSGGEEKNGALVRYDILCALRSLFEATGDDSVKAAAMALILTEQDDKYRKKYSGAWRGA
jgi:hypothetical protein